MQKNKVPVLIALCYSWSKDRQLDPYQAGLVATFAKLGFDVHVVLAQEFSVYSTYGFRPTNSETKIIDYIRNAGADLVLSMNHGGLTQAIQKGISCPIITWIVDDFPHIFYPDAPLGLSEMFGEKVHVIISSTELRNVLLKEAPGLANRTHLIPPATDMLGFERPAGPKKHNISFVGSSLDIRNIYRLLSDNAGSRKIFSSIMTAIRKLRENYRLDFDATVKELELNRLVSRQGWTTDQFKMLLANVISNNERIKIIDALHDLGFSLFGNSEWLKSLVASTAPLECFQAGDRIRTRSELAGVYQNSKISINIPQIQVGSALSYRVFDILASDALLITGYHPESDAFHFFGKDCPIPMYRDTTQLRELCEFYLNNEEARKEAVRKCNALVSRGYSFEERVRDILGIAALSIPEGLPPGNIRQLPRRFFRTHFFSLTDAKKTVRRMLRNLLRVVTSRQTRNKLIRLLQAAGSDR